MQNRKVNKMVVSLMCIMFVFGLLAAAGEAQVPKKINYQGFLKDKTGNPVNGAVPMAFALYDVASGGAALWSETRKVAVTAGNYSVDLGAVNPINLTVAKPYWLGVKVGFDLEMTPRKELTSAMYALLVDGITVKNGNVGIGTTNPTLAKLVVNGAVGNMTAIFGNSLPVTVTSSINPVLGFNAYYDNDWRVFTGGKYTGALGLHADDGDIAFATGNAPANAGDVANLTERLMIKQNGNVGIGTTNPNEKLTVYTVGGSTPVGAMSIDVGTFETGANALKSYFFRVRDIGYITHFYIRGDGNVGIGTTNPTYKLSVNGTIRAKEIIVNTGWSDFVFDQDYKLMPLSEVEQHITAEKHLPGIPSAQDVAANGVNLGDMQAKQLQKIEELTLYVIRMNKQLTALQQENESLKAKVSTLEQAAGK